MRWDVWDEVEPVLRARDIRPVLAVIPDNHDPSFDYQTHAPDFWDRVRGWQSAGWTIGLHGYQHDFVSDDRGICGTDSRSEFAGLPRAEQRRKLQAGMALFHEHGVTVDAFIAPNHSFDTTTVELVAEAGIPVINDGFSRLPHDDEHGTLWVPCQLNEHVEKRSGVWTIHYHTNYWQPGRLHSFNAELATMAGRITDLPSLRRIYGGRRRSGTDAAYSRYRLGRSRLRQWSAGMRSSPEPSLPRPDRSSAGSELGRASA
jgi:predicted deacetylase